MYPDQNGSPLKEPKSRGDENAATIAFAQRYPLRIMIADDNDINRRVLQLFLQRLGYHAMTTENGADCLDAVLRAPFDLVLLDIQMPEMSGMECARHIRSAGRQVFIVAVTANYPEVDRPKCLDAGMNGLIKKPVQFAELQQVLKEASADREKKAASR